MRQMNVGVIGCGDISGIYLKNCYRLANLRPVAVAALHKERAAAKVEEIKAKYKDEWKLAGEVELPRVCTLEELLASKDVEMVMNLTVPKAHFGVTMVALGAGKHVYSEKPLAISRALAGQIVALAKEKGLRVGCAPDTFLGAGLQTCRRVIDEGRIGEPIGCAAFFGCPGHELWHPDPEFYYQAGGGPVLDMAPYYLTALVHLMGPVRRVSGFARATSATRTILSAKKQGKVIPVETPTHVTSSLEFASGALGTMMMSFDVWGSTLPRIEIYGTRGAMVVPDPNLFEGEVKVKVGRGEWEVVELTHGYRENWRGLGAADMAAGIFSGRGHRASGELGYHVIDVIEGCLEAAREGRAVEVKSTAERPAAMPMGLKEGEID